MKGMDQEVRPNLAFYRGVSWLSRRIIGRTRRPHSHVAWIRPDGSVIEAWANGQGWMGGKVRHVASIHAQHTPGTVIDLAYLAKDLEGTPLAPETVAAIDARMAREIGKPYDYGAIFAWMRGRDYQNPQAWFCSELVQQIIAETAKTVGGFSAPLVRVESWQVSPGDMFLSPVIRVVQQVTVE